jgi:hypothetical protein
MVVDGTLDPALADGLASGGAEERGRQGKGSAGAVGHVVSSGPGRKLKSPTSLNLPRPPQRYD